MGSHAQVPAEALRIGKREPRRRTSRTSVSHQQQGRSFIISKDFRFSIIETLLMLVYFNAPISRKLVPPPPLNSSVSIDAVLFHNGFW